MRSSAHCREATGAGGKGAKPGSGPGALARADDHRALEHLCRYNTRPALAKERVQTNAAGEVVLKLKTPWRDSTTRLVMSPLEFMQRHAERLLCGSQIR